MILELIIALILVLAVSVFFYRSSSEEFQILQREYIPNTPWDDLLNEQLPVVIRNLPKSMQGGWSESRTLAKRWPVTLFDVDNQQYYKTTWDAYIHEQTIEQPVNMNEIAEILKLDETARNWRLDGFNKWYWLPTSMPNPIVAQPSYVHGVQKSLAEAKLIVNTDGGPLRIWLAHGGAIPPAVIPLLKGKNPWIQTTDDIPWITEVKYIELILRPGNALLLPRHWYYAIISEEMATWYWEAEFHSPISRLASQISK